MILDESWARRKEKLMEDNDLENENLNEKPLMPSNSLTEAAAAVTLLLDQLTERDAGRMRGSSRNDKV